MEVETFEIRSVESSRREVSQTAASSTIALRERSASEELAEADRCNLEQGLCFGLPATGFDMRLPWGIVGMNGTLIQLKAETLANFDPKVLDVPNCYGCRSGSHALGMSRLELAVASLARL